MTNGENNPNDLPDEDWAMSEPEKPVKKEIPVRQIDENVAKLYAPLDTGDLEGWDISLSDADPAAAPPSPPAPDKPSPGINQMPTEFQVPQHSFEILKPAAPPRSAAAEDWGMSPANLPSPDGWKMPEPIFRVSPGRSLKDSGKPPKATESPQFADQPVEENLSDIYAPPDTQEETAGSEEFNISEENIGILAEPEPSDAIQAPAAPSVRSYPPANQKSKSRKWLLIGFVIIAVAILAGLVTLAAFGLFFFKSQ